MADGKALCDNVAYFLTKLEEARLAKKEKEHGLTRTVNSTPERLSFVQEVDSNKDLRNVSLGSGFWSEFNVLDQVLYRSSNSQKGAKYFHHLLLFVKLTKRSFPLLNSSESALLPRLLDILHPTIPDLSKPHHLDLCCAELAFYTLRVLVHTLKIFVEPMESSLERAGSIFLQLSSELFLLKNSSIYFASLSRLFVFVKSLHIELDAWISVLQPLLSSSSSSSEGPLTGSTPLTHRTSSSVFPKLYSKPFKKLFVHCSDQIPDPPLPLLQTKVVEPKQQPQPKQQLVEDEDGEDMGVSVYMKTESKEEIEDKISIHTALLRVQSSSSSSSGVLNNNTPQLIAPLSGKKRPASSVSSDFLSHTPSIKRPKLSSSSSDLPKTPSSSSSSTGGGGVSNTPKPRQRTNFSTLFSPSSTDVPFSTKKKTPSSSITTTDKSKTPSGSSTGGSGSGSGGAAGGDKKKTVGKDPSSIFALLSGL